MDVILLSSSMGIIGALPLSKQSHEPLTKRIGSKIIRFTLLSSLWLFSFAIIEIIPKSRLILFGEDSLRNAYKVVLWVHCLWLWILLAGTVVMQFVASDHGEGTRRRRGSNGVVLSKATEKKASTPWHNIASLFLTLLLRIIKIPSIIVRKLRNLYDRSRNSSSSIGIIGNNDNKHKQWNSICNKGHLICKLCSYYIHDLFQTRILPAVIIGYIFSAIVLREVGRRLILVQDDNLSSLEIMVSRFVSIGLLISSILNGFGCVSFPYSCLVGLYHQPVTADTITKAEAELHNLVQILNDKRQSSHEEIIIANTTHSTTKSSSRWCQRRRFWNRTTKESKNNSNEQHLHQSRENEVKFLENLQEEITHDLEEMKSIQISVMRARTPHGKIMANVGKVFSLVLVVRLLAALRIVYYGNTSGKKSCSSDPITSLLLFLLGHHVISEQEYHSYSQGLSLIFAAILSLSQIRSFLRLLNTILRRFSCVQIIKRPLVEKQQSILYGSSRYTVPLVASTIMGSYFLSCIVLLKMALPLDYTLSFTSALNHKNDGSEIRFGLNTPAIQKIYIVSACVSAIMFLIISKIQCHNSKIREKYWFAAAAATAHEERV